jgi:hypothetical protein
MAACSQDAEPTQTTVVKGRSANYFSNEYYCDIGIPGYEEYCDDFGGGVPGDNDVACPSGLTYSQCQMFLEAMMHLEVAAYYDPNCVDAYDSYVSMPISYDPVQAYDGSNRVILGQTFYMGGDYSTDLYDGSFDNADDLMNTFAHEGFHAESYANMLDEDDAYAMGDECQAAYENNSGPARFVPRDGTTSKAFNIRRIGGK